MVSEGLEKPAGGGASPPLTFQRLPVYCAPGFLAQARTLAAEAGLEAGGECPGPVDIPHPFVLWLDGMGLSIRQTGRNAMGPVQCEFVTGEARHRRLYGGGKSQSIAKAVGIKDKIRPLVVDLTAGLGGDACALAGLGCKVVMTERHPVVAALLEDGLARGMMSADSGDRDLIARMSLVKMAAAEWLDTLADEQRPDVIYLDPMFPERRKSAKVNKNMQVFHQLVGDDPDADSLLPLALEKARYRVVVKRPSHAPFLNNRKPGLSMEGKAVRFDIYPLRSMANFLVAKDGAGCPGQH